MSPPLDEMHVVARRPISVDEATQLASSMGWQLDTRRLEQIYGRDADVPAAAWRIGRREVVKLVKSESLGHDYFVIRAADAPAVAQAITSTFPCYGFDEILDQLRAAPSTEQRRDALYRMAAARPPHCRRDVYDEICGGLFDNDEPVRVAAVACAARLGWRQLRPVLQKVSDEDGSDNIRALTWNLLGMADWSRG